MVNDRRLPVLGVGLAAAGILLIALGAALGASPAVCLRLPRVRPLQSRHEGDDHRSAVMHVLRSRLRA